MRAARALVFGMLGAGAISVISAVVRAIGVPIQMELILGTLTGIAPGPLAFAVGLAIHLAVGGLFGLLYGALFERVWDHGGASTGIVLGVLHAALIGLLFGLTPQFHPHIPELLPAPGPYFSRVAGVAGVLTFFALHILYGSIVGHGYGHVEAEKEWAPGAPRRV